MPTNRISADAKTRRDPCIQKARGRFDGPNAKRDDVEGKLAAAEDGFSAMGVDRDKLHGVFVHLFHGAKSPF